MRPFLKIKLIEPAYVNEYSAILKKIRQNNTPFDINSKTGLDLCSNQII